GLLGGTQRYSGHCGLVAKCEICRRGIVEQDEDQSERAGCAQSAVGGFGICLPGSGSPFYENLHGVRPNPGIADPVHVEDASLSVALREARIDVGMDDDSVATLAGKVLPSVIHLELHGELFSVGQGHHRVDPPVGSVRMQKAQLEAEWFQRTEKLRF